MKKPESPSFGYKVSSLALFSQYQNLRLDLVDVWLFSQEATDLASMTYFFCFPTPSGASTAPKLFVAQVFFRKFSGLKENHKRPKKLCNAISVSLNLHAVKV
jgi:hypothetical protein